MNWEAKQEHILCVVCGDREPTNEKFICEHCFETYKSVKLIMENIIEETVTIG